MIVAGFGIAITAMILGRIHRVGTTMPTNWNLWAPAFVSLAIGGALTAYGSYQLHQLTTRVKKFVNSMESWGVVTPLPEKNMTLFDSVTTIGIGSEMPTLVAILTGQRVTPKDALHLARFAYHHGQIAVLQVIFSDSFLAKTTQSCDLFHFGATIFSISPETLQLDAINCIFNALSDHFAISYNANPDRFHGEYPTATNTLEDLRSKYQSTWMTVILNSLSPFLQKPESVGAVKKVVLWAKDVCIDNNIIIPQSSRSSKLWDTTDAEIKSLLNQIPKSVLAPIHE